MTLPQIITEVFPENQILGIDEVQALLKLAAARPYKRESVRSILFRLFRQGRLKRFAVAGTWANVRYCRPECTATPEPIALQDWAAMIQAESERQLNPAENLVRMVERG